jgi:enoyl-CoA hydratase/carnithine racemase
MEEWVHYEVQDQNALICLNRPDKRNAINQQMMEKLHSSLLKAEEDNKVRTIIIYGEGPVFCAGIDLMFVSGIGQISGKAGSKFRAFLSKLQNIFTEMERIEKPIICTMHGISLGMGMELSLGADFRIITSDCRYSIPEVELGLIPDVGGTTRLTRLVGPGHAKEIIMTACEVPADKALAIGLINRIAEPGKHIEAALEMAAQLNKNAPLAVGLAKKVIDRGMHMDKLSLMELEGLAQSQLINTKDVQEGIMARMQKRKPEFKGM